MEKNLKEFNEDCIFSFSLDKNNHPQEPLIHGNIKNLKNDNIVISFNEMELPSEIDNESTFNLYGQTLDGKKFTAKDCLYQSFGSTKLIQNGLIITNKTIFINYLYIGEWITNQQLQKINNIKVRFSYLEHWFSHLKIDFQGEQVTDEIHIKELAKTYDKFMINQEIECSISKSWETKTIGNKKFIYDSKKFIDLNFENAVEIDKIFQIIFILNKFFQTLLPYKNVFVEDLTITTEEKYKLEIIYKQTNYHYEDEKVSFLDFLYLYHPKDVEIVISSWFKLEEKYGFIFTSLGLVLNDKSFIYAESQFLSYMQWLEGYCRIKYPSEEDEVVQFEKTIERIISQISNNEDKKLIREITQFKYETPLKKQLEKVFTEYEIKNILNINSRKVTSLIYKLITYRNKLTHLSEAQEYDINLLISLKNIIKNIIYIILAQELSLNKENYTYKKLIDDMVFNYHKV